MIVFAPYSPDLPAGQNRVEPAPAASSGRNNTWRHKLD